MQLCGVQVPSGSFRIAKLLHNAVLPQCSTDVFGELLTGVFNKTHALYCL